MKPSNLPTSAPTPNGPSSDLSGPILSLDEVHTYIGQYHILQGISMQVQRGAATVLLGRNGAGKTTTLKTIMGLTAPKKGAVAFNGEKLEGEITYKLARRGIGYVPEDRGIFRDMTVEENLKLAARGISGGEYRQRLDFCTDLFPDMHRFMKQKAGTLSGGQQQMVAMSRGLMVDNKLLLIDEPSKGLAPIVVQAVIEALVKLKEHITILLVEQNFTMASIVGDYFYLIDDGHNIANGTMERLINDKDLTRQYLGVGGV